MTKFSEEVVKVLKSRDTRSDKYEQALQFAISLINSVEKITEEADTWMLKYNKAEEEKDKILTELQELREKVKDLYEAHQNNSGYEPSKSLFEKEFDDLIAYLRGE